MKKATLSVIIANYNHGKYLKTLIPALLTQTRVPDEIIIVDDGSTDDSVSIVESFAKNNPVVQLLCNEKNQGVIYSINRAFECATGDYVSFPSADNYVKLGIYEKSMALLEKHPEAGLCCSDPLTWYEQTGKTDLKQLKLSDVPCYFSPTEVIELYHKKRFCVGNICHTAVVKRDAIKALATNKNYFDPNLKWHCDFFFVNAIAFRYGVCYVPEGFAIFREESSSYSRKAKPWKERRQVYSNMLDLLDRPDNQDIRDGFQRSGVLAEFSYYVLRIICFRPKYYGYFTKSYASRVIKQSVRDLLFKYGSKIPFARRVYRRCKRLRTNKS